MSLYTPARAVMIVQDNGEDVMVELPEIQELLDQISNLKCNLYEVCRDADLAIEAKRADFRRLIKWAAAGWMFCAGLLLWGCFR